MACVQFFVHSAVDEPVLSLLCAVYSGFCTYFVHLYSGQNTVSVVIAGRGAPQLSSP